ncbi:MAG: hypothetical protein Q8N54_10765 [Sulfurimicrobium sp.]|nr:hypothetical protein [Sulfurimicrobium sp.]MDP1703133.1 hypothetical protein [Sulfurimicrobium sp.]MDP2197150.1 hypothetical protein [Sulfurimicrobium sp.]MDP2963229.1 hypothetical protein [Sulfurimicrobium sp.]MDP3687344.1 hypothetical protein [Sulfurimicrobium sp.]
MNASPERHARIFLLSHMRALTSLAGHILGSHPEINGYYEMHISYEDASALDKQLEVFQESDVLKKNSRYLFDKLLHNDYVLKPGQLGPANIKILISLLEPERTIKSIVDLFAQKEIEDPYASPLEAANYYIARVQALADFSRTANQPYYYFDAELLQRTPESLLPRLSDWLELDTPLAEHYQVFSQTGKARKGDSSGRIHSGRIDRTPTDRSHIAIPENVLGRAREVYRECRREIIGNAADSVRLG